MPREVGEWTKNKLKYLSDYLPVYLQATTKAVERIYIDAFAGPGTNRVRATGETISGSPLIALDARSKNGTRFDRLFFIERDERAANELRNLVAESGEERRARVIPGDVNVKLPELIRTLPKRSPTFVFLDTEGIEPKWTTIEELRGWRTELLINFPLGMAINRNPASDKVTDYFGTDEWRRFWESTSTGHLRQLLDLYKGRLKALGWEHTTDADPLHSGHWRPTTLLPDLREQSRACQKDNEVGSRATRFGGPAAVQVLTASGEAFQVLSSKSRPAAFLPTRRPRSS